MKKKRYLFLKKGILKSTEINECVKESTLSEDPVLYADFMIRNIDWVKIGFIPKDSSFAFLDVVTDESGKPFRVYSDIDNEILKNEAIRVAKLIEWKRVYKNERYIHMNWIVPIIFYNDRGYLIEMYTDVFDFFSSERK